LIVYSKSDVQEGRWTVGRTREYDEDTVLTGAMHAFRRQGYLGVSVKDLERATGLKAGSIYNSYGDKAGLFTAAFAHYNRAVLGRRIAGHAPAAAGLAGLRDLFASLLHEPGGGSSGCLITNSAIEFGGGSAALPGGVSDGLHILLELFTDRLGLACRTGQLRGGTDPATAALGLLALYQGILVLVRAGWDGRQLQALIDDAFDRLEEPGRDR
jgi:TetR/AcrR family transcriptional regulator, transcriptional repressor for nem operon